MTLSHWFTFLWLSALGCVVLIWATLMLTLLANTLRSLLGLDQRKAQQLRQTRGLTRPKPTITPVLQTRRTPAQPKVYPVWHDKLPPQ